MTKVQIVDELMAELGKSSSKVRQVLEQHVGDITIELLSQQEGRFIALKRETTITINTSYDHYKLPADFGTASKTFIQVDENDDFVRRLKIESEEAIYDRLEHDEYAGVYLGMVKSLTTGDADRGYTSRGWYLVLPTEPDETGYYKFFYYRLPTAEDTDLIRNASIIKQGVKGRILDLNPNAVNDALIYERMKSGFKENPERYQPEIKIHPNERTRRHNARMHSIGKGRD